MYLKIGEKQYSVSRRVVTEDTIKYLSVSYTHLTLPTSDLV